MENKINIAELLEDCPKGMELYSPLCGTCTFDRISFGTIICKKQNTQEITFTSEGYYMLPVFDNCECMIFPSKDQRDWGKFHRPFRDGDILVYKHKPDNVKYTFIYKRRINMHYLVQYCGWFSEKPCLSEQFNVKERIPLYENDDIKFATEEERQKLFQAIKDNGYCWDAETNTLKKLVKPIFKKGDKVRPKKGFPEPHIARIIEDVCDTFYTLALVGKIDFTDQHNWELVPSKFDVATLKPFDKVLVRDGAGFWRPTLFGMDMVVGYRYFTASGSYKRCIPYEGNEHLLGTRNDCDEYYKTWE